MASTLMVMACTAVYLSRNPRSPSEVHAIKITTYLTSPASNTLPSATDSPMISKLISISTKSNITVRDNSTTINVYVAPNMSAIALNASDFEDINYDSWETFNNDDDDNKEAVAPTNSSNDKNTVFNVKVEDSEWKELQENVSLASVLENDLRKLKVKEVTNL